VRTTLAVPINHDILFKKTGSRSYGGFSERNNGNSDIVIALPYYGIFSGWKISGKEQVLMLYKR